MTCDHSHKNINLNKQKSHCKGGFIGTFPIHRAVYQSYNATIVIQSIITFFPQCLIYRLNHCTHSEKVREN